MNGLDTMLIKNALIASIQLKIAERDSAEYSDTKKYIQGNIENEIETLNKVQDNFIQKHFVLDGSILREIFSPLQLKLAKETTYKVEMVKPNPCDFEYGTAERLSSL